jgi:hypothetical protein
MSPKEKHITDDAQRTTISLTDEDRAAILWIKSVRRKSRDKRKTTNDILVDALWHFMEKTQGKTKEYFRPMVPPNTAEERPQSKIAEMPKPMNKQ